MGIRSLGEIGPLYCVVYIEPSRKQPKMVLLTSTSCDLDSCGHKCLMEDLVESLKRKVLQERRG